LPDSLSREEHEVDRAGDHLEAELRKLSTPRAFSQLLRSDCTASEADWKWCS
jgi:hypothetical protein